MDDRPLFGDECDSGAQSVVLCTETVPLVGLRPKRLGWSSGWAREVRTLPEPDATWPPPSCQVTRVGQEEPSPPGRWADLVLADRSESRELSGEIDFELVGHVWLAQRLLAAARQLSELVTVDPDVKQGVPVLAGTRFPVARLLAEVADDRTLSDIAEDHDLRSEALAGLFHAMAAYLSRPLAE